MDEPLIGMLTVSSPPGATQTVRPASPIMCVTAKQSPVTAGGEGHSNHAVHSALDFVALRPREGGRARTRPAARLPTTTRALWVLRREACLLADPGVATVEPVAERSRRGPVGPALPLRDRFAHGARARNGRLWALGASPAREVGSKAALPPTWQASSGGLTCVHVPLDQTANPVALAPAVPAPVVVVFSKRAMKTLAAGTVLGVMCAAATLPVHFWKSPSVTCSVKAAVKAGFGRGGCCWPGWTWCTLPKLDSQSAGPLLPSLQS